MDKKKIVIIFTVGLVIVVGVGGFFYFDWDNDGLNTYEEIFNTNTDFFSPDSDGDGLDDGVEVNEYGTNPNDSDSDGDGLEDETEVDDYGSDPLEADSDGDGLDDSVEVNQYGTDPSASDTDDDGLEDETEVDSYSTDPLESDTDSDGLDDGEELNDYDTDPLEADSDSDDLQDGAEVKTHGSDPLKADTDKDGLDDGEEVLDYDTNPNSSDTDYDGLTDYEEVKNYGTDPSDSDTDDDALKDGEEADLFAADPLRKDVFVEVDFMSNAQSLSSDAISTLKNHFSNAPVSNPDGSWGVSLHIDIDDEIFRDVETVEFSNEFGSYNDFGDFKDSYFTDGREDTHHYALLAKFVESDGEKVGGVCSPYSNDFMVSTHRKIISLFSYDWVEPVADSYVGSTFMHELGHALGLSLSDFEGIDSKKYSFGDYPSAMNYNASVDKSWLNKLNYLYPFVDYYGYSNNNAFDDWAHLAKGLEHP